MTGKSKMPCECATACAAMNGMDMFTHQAKVDGGENTNVNKGRCMCMKVGKKKIVMKARKEKKGVVSGFISDEGKAAYSNRKED